MGAIRCSMGRATRTQTFNQPSNPSSNQALTGGATTDTSATSNATPQPEYQLEFIVYERLKEQVEARERGPQEERNHGATDGRDSVGRQTSNERTPNERGRVRIALPRLPAFLPGTTGEQSGEEKAAYPTTSTTQTAFTFPGCVSAVDGVFPLRNNNANEATHSASGPEVGDGYRYTVDPTTTIGGRACHSTRGRTTECCHCGF